MYSAAADMNACPINYQWLIVYPIFKRFAKLTRTSISSDWSAEPSANTCACTGFLKLLSQISGAVMPHWHTDDVNLMPSSQMPTS